MVHGPGKTGTLFHPLARTWLDDAFPRCDLREHHRDHRQHANCEGEGVDVTRFRFLGLGPGFPEGRGWRNRDHRNMARPQVPTHRPTFKGNCRVCGGDPPKVELTMKKCSGGGGDGGCGDGAAQPPAWPKAMPMSMIGVVHEPTHSAHKEDAFELGVSECLLLDHLMSGRT